MSGSGTGIVTPYDTHRAIDLDGAADYYTRAADLLGNAGGRLGIISLWFRIDGGNGANRWILQDTAVRVAVLIDNLNRFWVRMQSAVPVTLLEYITTPTYLAGSGWHHAAISYELTGPSAALYIDGVAVPLAVNTLVAGVVDYSYGGINWSLGAVVGGAAPWNGALSEIYVNFAENIDLTAAANLELLRHPNGQPPNIGAQGQLVTTNQPIGYFVEEGGVLVNRGYGGVFVTAGAPALSADSPKDRWVASLNQHRRRRIHYAG